MTLNLLLPHPPSVRQLVRLFAATAVALLAFSVPARAHVIVVENADVIVVENEEEWELLKKIWKASQESFLKASEGMTACYQNDNTKCADNMRALIPDQLPPVFRKDKNKYEYFEVRNNSFRYQRAFTLLLLNAIISANPGASCDVYSHQAALPMTNRKNKSTIRTLAQQLAQAATEVHIVERQHLPEYQMYRRIESVLKPCVGRV